MKKYLFLFLLLGLVSYKSIAKPINQAQAEAIASRFLNKGRSLATSLKFQSIPYQLRTSMGVIVNEPFYIFNVENDGGFVIVSGDDEFTNILAYAEKGNFDLENAPGSLIEWMKVYSRYINVRQKRQNLPTQESVKSIGTVVVQPLLNDIKWGQDYPFNTQCPTYTTGGNTKHYYSGCVVAAATQIMKYYNYPEKGIGSKSYVSTDGKTLTANFGETTYDWNNMLSYYPGSSIPQNQIDAPSLLAAHFGIAVEMEYLPGGSGAYTMLVPTAFKDHFGYDKRTNMRVRNYYSTSEWMNMIKTELDARRPVYYGGTSEDGQSGHAFVCDGYDTNDYVSINWGWYGKSNGFFMVNHLNPDDLGEGGGTGGYNLDQEIIIGIQPPGEGNEDVCLPLYGGSRLTVTPYENTITLMTFLENFDTHAFSGSIGAILTKNGKFLRLLKEAPTSIDGFAKGKSGVCSFLMRDIPTTLSGIEDGKYEIRLGYKSSIAKQWQIIRHYTGFPGYVDVTLQDGITVIDGIHTLKSDVKLLEKISADGALYAKGTAIFKLNFRNNSNETRIKKINIQLQSTSNPEIKSVTTTRVNIYEESTATLSIMVTLDENLSAGEYEVTAYANDSPDDKFDDSEAGRAIMTIHPESKIPIIRLVQAIEWKNDNSFDVIKQGDNIYLALAVRNYGPSGKVGIITYLQDIDNPERQYVFQQKNIDLAAAQSLPVTFYRKIPVDPGTYRICASYLTEDGQNLLIDPTSTECRLTITENPDVTLNIMSFNLPDNLEVKKKITGDITFQAPKNFNGLVYLRLRQLTNTNGEIVYMGSHTIKSGESKTIPFSYSPTVVPGTYMALFEAKSGATEGTIGEYNDCYRIVTVSDPLTGIKDINAQSKVELYSTEIIDKIYLIKKDNCIIHKADLINLQGSVILSKNNIDNSIDISSLNKGIYLLRLSIDDDDAVIMKIVKK